MQKNYSRFQKFKELDLFIQNSLDKYFYVEPWQKLYNRTGKFHRDIISDKSTIPDLIIYNKTFNKSECFLESNEKTNIKFPRMRFILRPKYKKEYNPLSTYGKDDEVYFYIKKETSGNLKNNYTSSNYAQLKDEIDKNDPKTFLKQNLEPNSKNEIIFQQKNKINEKKQNSKILKNIEDEEDEVEPEWADDNVENYNNIDIEFKAIPKYIEDKMAEDVGFPKEKINNSKSDNIYDNYKKNNIDVDLFFKSNSFTNINNIKNTDSPKNNNEIQDFKEDMDENYSLKELINKDKNNENDMSSDYERQENRNKHFNIFDTENKFNEIFIESQKPDNSDNNPKNDDIFIKRNNSRFFNNNNQNLNEINKIKELEEEKIKNLILIQQQQKQKVNQQYIQTIQMQNINNKFKENQNNFIPNQNSYMKFYNSSYPSNYQMPFYNNQNVLRINSPYNHINYINYINGNLMNINYFPFSSNNQGNNITNMNINDANNLNKMNMSGLNFNNNINYVNNNDKDLYINNVNNILYRNIINQNYNKNLNNNLYFSQKAAENNVKYSNLNFISQNNVNSNNSDNIFYPSNIRKYGQNEENNYNKNINNNINDNIINNKISQNNIYNNKIKKINEQNNSQKDLKGNDNSENNTKYINYAEYLENPNLILTKNLQKKNWLILNNDNSIIHNFDSVELLNFLEEKKNNGISLEDFIINDYDTDVVFPAKVIYENLKNYYSNIYK